ncbi:hypothetical protein B0J18DRAFT_492231 [Chaetomium sp. MPI-SDFR-AT-0129]|nr:hypothetical protein B0J18DRAFT_492231 [Chaetomium sp. MPI-SDFR-AT-0129]
MVLVSIALLSFISFLGCVRADDDCQPVQWSNDKPPTRVFRTNNAAPRILSLITTGNVTAGEVNCRYSATTGNDVNYYTCTQLATKFGVSIDLFFTLNPTLERDCSNIQPNTEYCVDGFIEPLRAVDGLCGPPNQNATCLGTAYQCCNSETWTCGNSTDDCAAGTCYEGACVGDKVYSTDGTCGKDYGDRLCAGKWGDCCNLNGTCGTGEAYCGLTVCQMGNCTQPDGGQGCPTGTSTISSSSTSSSSSSSSVPATTTAKTTTTNAACTTNISSAFSAVPSCGQLCFNNMLSQYSTLGCASPTDSACLCGNANFGYGVRDCSNGACGSNVADASSAIAYGSAFCSCATGAATGTATATATATTGLGALPSCGQLCFNNMLAQYASFGCASEQDAACLCEDPDFGYGLRDCSNGACGTAVASTVIAYGSSYCASATATATATRNKF